MKMYHIILLPTYICYSNWDRSINHFTTTIQVQVAVNVFRSYLATYLMCYRKTILKTQATISNQAKLLVIVILNFENTYNF